MAFTGIAQGQRVPEDQERGNVMEHVMAVKESKKREKQKQGKKMGRKENQDGGRKELPRSILNPALPRGCSQIGHG